MLSQTVATPFLKTGFVNIATHVCIFVKHGLNVYPSNVPKPEICFG